MKRPSFGSVAALALIFFFILGGFTGYEIKGTIVEAGTQETMTIPQVIGWCVRGNIQAMQEWTLENEMRMVTREEILEALPKVHEYCSESLAEFRGWLATQEEETE